MSIFAYFRAEADAGTEVSFVLGKSRSAPIKQLSIPRLELQAALYSVRLRKLIVDEHDLLMIVLHVGQILLQYFNGYNQQKEGGIYLSPTEQLKFWKRILLMSGNTSKAS